MFRVSTPQRAALPRKEAESPPGRQTGPCRVAFCGPIGDVGKPAGGGYEAANRRTCDALRRRGLDVVELPYPKITPSPALRALRYAASFARTAAFLLLRARQYDVLHLTPLNMHFAFAETWLVSCAKLMGKPVLMDVRAGRFLRYYQGSGRLYRGTIDRMLRRASRVAVEGQEFIPFMRQRTRQPVFYFPNFVDTPSLPPDAPARTIAAGETVRLLYFGRLVPEKGVDTALQAVAMLAGGGHAVHLEFIGEGPAGYVDQMRQQHAHLPVTWTPSLPVADILQRARDAHFFFFASRHEGEGHSNALNEAMSVGLVPVCSEQGFTRGVVGNAGVVLPVAAGAADYAAAIEGVLADDRWPRLSERARTRVRTLYSEDAAVPALIDTYQRMRFKAG